MYSHTGCGNRLAQLLHGCPWLHWETRRLSIPSHLVYTQDTFGHVPSGWVLPCITCVMMCDPRRPDFKAARAERTFCFLLRHSPQDVVVLSARGGRGTGVGCIGTGIAPLEGWGLTAASTSARQCYPAVGLSYKAGPVRGASVDGMTGRGVQGAGFRTSRDRGVGYQPAGSRPGDPGALTITVGWQVGVDSNET